MLGHTEDEIENQFTEWKERVHPDDLQKALDDVQAHVAGKTSSYVNEHRMRHKNGSWVWILDRGMVISHDKNGKPLRMIGTHADITESKRITQILESLASSSASALGFEHFLQEVLGNLTKFYGNKYAFVGQLLPDGKHVRTLALRVGGQPAENFEYDLKGTPCQDILDLKAKLIPCDASKLYPGDKLLVDMGVDSYYGSPLISADNKPLGLVSIMDTEPMDIDPLSEPLLKIVASRIALELERLNSEQELREQRDFNDTVVEAAGNVIVILDTSGRIVKFNRAAEEMTGFSRKELIGQPIWDWVIPEEQKPGVQNVFDQLMQGNTGIAGRYINDWMVSDGSRRTLDWRNTIILDEHGTATHLVALGYDITERIRIEDELRQLNVNLEARVDERTHELTLASNQADAANQAKSNFLSNMSHEIRSPLAAIIGFSESLATDDFNEQERKKISSTIVRNGKHLLQVINDILDLSKIEAGQLEVELINVSIFMLLGEVDSLVGMNARDKGLEFKFNYDFPLPESIVTDPTYLKQILINLCSNAIKFTHEGRIDIDVSCDSDFRQLQIVVSDSGIGMTAEEASRVFDPFSQADSSITRKYGGTGLGLSISNKLAKALNGSLTCESRKDQGSRFTVTVANQDENEVVIINRLEDVSLYYDEKSTQAVIKPLAGSILLVEDSPDNQQLISMFIHKTGAQITIAENGKQAIEKAQAGEFDLILMDMQMPVMDGLEAMRQLRASGYKRPIVSLTANVMLSDRQKCEAAGADDYLVKPIELHKFYHVLNTYLSEDISKASDGKNSDLKKAMQDSPQYKALVAGFLAKLPQLLDELSSALVDENWDELQAKSHDLKGMGGALGYPEITEKAGLINTLVKQKNYDQLADAGAELEKLTRGIIQQRGTKNVLE